MVIKMTIIVAAYMNAVSPLLMLGGLGASVAGAAPASPLVAWRREPGQPQLDRGAAAGASGHLYRFTLRSARRRKCRRRRTDRKRSCSEEHDH